MYIRLEIPQFFLRNKKKVCIIFTKFLHYYIFKCFGSFSALVFFFKYVNANKKPVEWILRTSR